MSYLAEKLSKIGTEKCPLDLVMAFGKRVFSAVTGFWSAE